MANGVQTYLTVTSSKKQNVCILSRVLKVIAPTSFYRDNNHAHVESNQTDLNEVM